MKKLVLSVLLGATILSVSSCMPQLGSGYDQSGVDNKPCNLTAKEAATSECTKPEEPVCLPAYSCGQCKHRTKGSDSTKPTEKAQEKSAVAQEYLTNRCREEERSTTKTDECAVENPKEECKTEEKSACGIDFGFGKSSCDDCKRIK